MCRMKASPINIRLTSRYSAGSYAFAVEGLCALFSAFKIRSGTQFDGCADLYTFCRDKSHTYLLLPQIVFCNLPDSGRHVTSASQGLSLSRSMGAGRREPWERGWKPRAKHREHRLAQGWQRCQRSDHKHVQRQRQNTTITLQLEPMKRGNTDCRRFE